MISTFKESKFLVERDRPGVTLPHAEPNHVRAMCLYLFDARRHQSLGNAFPVPIARNIHPLDLTKRIAGNETRRFAPT